MKKHSYYTDMKGNSVALYTIKEIFAMFIGGKFKDIIDYCRYLIDKERQKDYDIKKTELPAFTPNGVFREHRKSDAISEYSNLMVLDVDKLSAKKVNLIKQKAAGVKYTFAVAISPSGRGLKIFIQTDNTVENHKATFDSLLSYYQVVLGVDIDTSGGDLARLCFVTHDPDMYVNDKASIFNDIGMGIDVVKLSQQYERIKEITEYSFDSDNEITFSEKELPRLAENCNMYGLPKEITLSLMEKEFKVHADRVTEAVNTAYANVSEFNSLYLLLNDVEQMFSVDIAKATQFQRAKDWLNKFYDLRYNEVTKTTEIKEKAKNTWMHLDDFLENSAYTNFKLKGSRINKGDFDSMLKSNLAESYNPFVDYFHSLKPWKEGDPDYIQLLCDTVQTTKQEFWYTAFRKWIVAVVKGLLDDDTYNETEIIFTGKQGAYKSTWLRNLLPAGMKQYYYEGVVDPHNKDHQMMLSTMMFINMDDMDIMTRTQQGVLKQFITQKIINVRRPYGRNNEVWIRRASFFGSVNQEQFLNDPTGSRRFLCFKVISINGYHNIKMDDVYRQALYLAQNGFTHYFSGEEIDKVSENNEDFQYRTFEEELLVKYFEPTSADDAGAKHLNATSILTRLAERTKGMGSINTGHVANMGKILHKHGYKGCKHKKIFGYFVKELSDAEVAERETEPITKHKEFKVELGEYEPKEDRRSRFEKIDQSRFEEEFGFQEGETIDLWHTRLREKILVKGSTLQQCSDWYRKLEFGLSVLHDKRSRAKEAEEQIELTRVKNVLRELMDGIKEKLTEYENSFFAELKSWGEEKIHSSFTELSAIEKELSESNQKMDSRDYIWQHRQIEEYMEILEGMKRVMVTAMETVNDYEQVISFLQELAKGSSGAFKKGYECRIDMHRWAKQWVISRMGNIEGKKRNKLDRI